MKICIVSGSSRGDSNSLKVAQYLRDELQSSKVWESVVLLDLAKLGLPLWDELFVAQGSDYAETLNRVSAELASSDAFIVISPEWHGMAAPVLKNFFMFWHNSELSHKPALPVAISSGGGGAYPIAELRMSSYKNNRICYLPEHLIVRYADGVLNDADDLSKDDNYIRGRITYCLELLATYAAAFVNIRQSDVIANQQYPNGM